jgi:2-desacetyl-2-hydroxyethyl bacteriochlorophyllide A dehydrogenase
MKAVVFKKAGTLAVEDIPEPEAGPGEVIVKVRKVGICGSDLHLCQHGLVPPGYVLGHEMGGTIARIGADVTGWSEGDRVWVCPGGACGACDACRRDLPERCSSPHSIGVGQLPGGYAEYIRVPAVLLTRLADEFSFEEAALIDPVGCGVWASSLAKVEPGQNVFVMGAGPIGLYLMMHLQTIIGEGKVILSEPAAGRAKLAAEIGADIVLDPKKDDIESELASLTGGVGADVVFECVGIPETINQSVSLVKTGGDVVWIGVCMEPTTILPVTWTLKHPTIHVSLGFGSALLAPGYLDFIHENEARMRKTITETISLDEVPNAFERLLKPNQEAKIMIDL